MKIILSKSDIVFLKKADAYFDAESDLEEDEALSFLEKIHDVEIFYANSDKKSDLRYAKIYADIADRVEAQI